MARNRSHIRAEKNSFVNLESSIKKLNSLMIHPDLAMWLYSGAATGVRSKLLAIDYKVIRSVIDKVPLVNSIITTRIDQLLPFCKRAESPGDKGFEIIPAMTPKEKVPKSKQKEDPKIKELSDFIAQTGFSFSSDREDDFMDYVQLTTREILSVDQVATEIQYNRMGEAAAFTAVDGSSIHRTDPQRSPYPPDVKYVQIIDAKVYGQYTDNNLIFDYKNKRADLRFRGFGYSPVEMAIDIITTLLFGYQYTRDQFIKDRIPRGFISVMGDVSPEQLESIRGYWYAAMSGAGGRWSIPILPSGKDGVGMDFKLIGQTNKEMEYHKMMMFVSSIIAAVYSIDLAELGIKSEDSQALFEGSNTRPKLEASRSKGLGSLLAFLEQHLNKVLRKVTTDYKFRFVGFEKEDEKQREEIITQQLQTRRTVNDLRRADGDDEIDEDYANVVLNAQAVQIYLNQKNMEQQEKMQQQQGMQLGMGGGEPGAEGQGEAGASPEGAEAEGEKPEGNEGETDFRSLFKSLTKAKEKRVQILIE
jgi:hypothetical protein